MEHPHASTGPVTLDDEPFGAVVPHPSDPVVLVMTGEVDVAVSQEVLVDLPSWRDVEVVDASGTTFIDSSGVGLLVQLARLVGPRRLRVVGATGQPRDALLVLGTEHLFDLS